MNAQSVDYKVKTFKARSLASFFLVALLLTACTVASATSKSLESFVQPIGQVGAEDNFKPRWGDIQFCS
jgi:hypothetical protein